MPIKYRDYFSGKYHADAVSELGSITSRLIELAQS
jgi:hypothetical protein